MWLWVRSPISVAVGQEPHKWLWLRSPISVAVGQEPLWVAVRQEAPRVDVGQDVPCGSGAP